MAATGTTLTCVLKVSKCSAKGVYTSIFRSAFNRAGRLFLRECKVTGTAAVFSVTRSEALTLLCPPLPGDLANVSCQWPGPSIINAPNSAAS